MTLFTVSGRAGKDSSLVATIALQILMSSSQFKAGAEVVKGFILGPAISAKKNYCEIEKKC
jgi:hypothetical protein